MNPGPEKTSIPAVVLGATGYVGGEFLRLLAMHPVFKLHAAVSKSRAGERIADTFPHLACAYRDARFVAHEQWIDAIDEGSDLAVFSAAPHGASAAMINTAIETAANKHINLHVVDASADFRYTDRAAFEAVYGGTHGAPDLLGSFSSGLPEHVDGTPTPHIGHPGCFASAILFAAVPLLQAGLCDHDLFVSGITGSTGSGRLPQPGTHHPERQSNFYAYKALEHRHTPEIVALAAAATGTTARLHFVPHSGPFARGIYVTLQTRAHAGTTLEQLHTVFVDTYRDAGFIDVIDSTPRLKNVVASNRCQIGLALQDETIVVISALDNLVKGAAGGSLQWMNRLFGLPEASGLTALAPGWT